MTTNDPPYLLWLSHKTLEVHAAATNYINQFLQKHKFTELDQLTEEHVEGENFSTCLRIFSIGYPAHDLGLIRIIRLETHPNSNSSR